MINRWLKTGFVGTAAGISLLIGSVLYDGHVKENPDSSIAKTGYEVEEFFKYESDDKKLTVRFRAHKLIAYSGMGIMGLSLIPTYLGVHLENRKRKKGLENIS